MESRAKIDVREMMAEDVSAARAALGIQPPATDAVEIDRAEAFDRFAEDSVVLFELDYSDSFPLVVPVVQKMRRRLADDEDGGGAVQYELKAGVWFDQLTGRFYRRAEPDSAAKEDARLARVAARQDLIETASRRKG